MDQTLKVKCTFLWPTALLTHRVLLYANNGRKATDAAVESDPISFE